jgi:glucosamine-6-phosphate deaminase
MGADAAEDVAQKIKELLDKQENINMIFAAAPSQNEFLAALAEKKEVEWKRIKAFHMDVYVGLDKDHPERFGNFLKERIFDQVPFQQVYYLNGNINGSYEECWRYTKLLRRFPADIVCMGIGENTHLAFNDPHVADFNDPFMVKVVNLDETSRLQQVHDGCFENIKEVPVSAITLTVPALLQADHIYCIVPGMNKANAVYHTLKDEVSERYPSTSLRKHPDAILYLDKESASKLDQNYV